MAQAVARKAPSVHWWCPALPPSPKAAIALIEEGCANWPSQSSAIVGSSLGGFYATWLAQRLGWKTVVINPAVYPARDLANYIGSHSNWHDPQEQLFFAPSYVDQLQALQSPSIAHPERIMAWITQGDEVLDWREMAHHYAQTQLHILEGGDHAFSDFAAHLDEIWAFLELP